MCATVWRHLVKATEVTAGLAESRPNGSLPPGGWFKVTCGLTACTPGSAPGQALGNEYGKTLPVLVLYFVSFSEFDMGHFFCDPTRPKIFLT